MSFDGTHTMTYRVHPAPPPTHNVLTSEQKAQLRRSSTKLTRVLGAAPQVIDDNTAVSRPLSPQPCLSISCGRSSSSHKRTKSADPELFPLSSSPRPPSRENSRRARASTDAQIRTSNEVHPIQPSKQHHRESRHDDSMYEPTFSIPSETKAKRDKLARVCKILGRDVPNDLVFNAPPSYDDVEKADRKAAKKAARTPLFPEDCVRSQSPAPPARAVPTYAFPEDYLPHIRAEREKEAAEKERKAAEKKAKSGRRSFMPFFPEECVGDRFEPEAPILKRGPTFTFPEDYLPHIAAQLEANEQAAAALKMEQHARRYSSQLKPIAELKPAPRDSSSSDSSSSDDEIGRYSYLSTTTSSSYRVHPSALSPPYANQPATTAGRREITVRLPFLRKTVDNGEFDIVHGMNNLRM